VILDCGSNIGTSLLYFGKKYPNGKVIGFEADKRIAKISISNLARNSIYNVEVINSAVWTNNDGIEFSFEGADGGSIHGSTNIKRVNSVRLKDFLDKLEFVDFLKIDIEGAENVVLIDCCDSLTKVQNLFVEYHSYSKNRQSLSDILSVLEKNNFRYYIEHIRKNKQPFINKSKDLILDLQLNIFCYRDET